MLHIVLIAAGFLLGLAFGRWWALLAALAFGLGIGITEEVEVSGWVIGVGYGGLAALGIASGIGGRRLLSRRGAGSL